MRKGRRVKSFVFLAAVTALVVGALAAPPRRDIIHVPGDYPTIQGAIDAAFNGDAIVVAPGTYNETIDLLGKAIRIRSSKPRILRMSKATG